MKRILAIGAGLVALAAFLFYQPVAGGSLLSPNGTLGPSKSGATLAPSSTSTTTTIPAPEASSTPESKSTPKANVAPGSSSASLQGNSAQPPSIAGGPKGGDDEDGDENNREERHHKKKNHLENGEDGHFEGDDD